MTLTNTTPTTRYTQQSRNGKPNIVYPPITGTQKQKKYASDIRFATLYSLLINIIEVSDCFKKDDRPILFQTVNQLRAEIDPSFWIEFHQSKIQMQDYLISQIQRHHELQNEELYDWMETHS